MLSLNATPISPSVPRMVLKLIGNASTRSTADRARPTAPPPARAERQRDAAEGQDQRATISATAPARRSAGCPWPRRPARGAAELQAVAGGSRKPDASRAGQHLLGDVDGQRAVAGVALDGVGATAVVAAMPPSSGRSSRSPRAGRGTQPAGPRPAKLVDAIGAASSRRSSLSSAPAPAAPPVPRSPSRRLRLPGWPGSWPARSARVRPARRARLSSASSHSLGSPRGRVTWVCSTSGWSAVQTHLLAEVLQRLEARAVDAVLDVGEDRWTLAELTHARPGLRETLVEARCSARISRFVALLDVDCDHRVGVVRRGVLRITRL